jgi:predicted SAM-dependent methyltransferase
LATDTDTVFPGWDWQDPDSLAARMDEFSAGIARCASLERVADRVPGTRAELSALGVTGIEFAAFRTAHPAGLATDLAPLRDEQAAAELGPVYRVDGAGLFTRLDIGEPLPLEDAAVDWVYAEHLIEHVTLPVAIRWLTEVRRILAPGGVLRLTTPDLAAYVAGYGDGDRFYAAHRRRLRTMRVGPPMPERRAFMMNQIFYLYGHRWIYDFDEIRYALSEAGFKPDEVRQCRYREGARPDVADLDTPFRRDETLYAEVTA